MVSPIPPSSFDCALVRPFPLPFLSLHLNPNPIIFLLPNECSSSRKIVLLVAGMYLKSIEAKPKQNLDALLGLDGVGELGVGLGDGVSLDEAADGLAEELDIVEGVVALHLLVQVGVEGDLLDVLGVAKLDEGLAGAVVGVEDLLEEVEECRWVRRGRRTP